MKKLIIILTIAVTSCTGQVKTDERESESSHEKENTESVLQLNNGSKWKADDATKKNVAAILQVIKDSSYSDKSKRMELHANLQTKIDLLVKECRMKGEEHEMLHVWLRKILKDIKELKGEDHEYLAVYEALKKDIESFYAFFE